MTASASRVLDAFPRAVTCIDAKGTSMLIHTALTNGHIPPVRGVTGLPGAMSGCGATCTYCRVNTLTAPLTAPLTMLRDKGEAGLCLHRRHQTCPPSTTPSWRAPLVPVRLMRRNTLPRGARSCPRRCPQAGTRRSTQTPAARRTGRHESKLRVL